MTAFFDVGFRVISAAIQGDNARVRALLDGMTDIELAELAVLARLVGEFGAPIAIELAYRVLRTGADPA